MAALPLARIFPVKKNKVVFTAFEGDGGYCCNPRYIAEELLKNETLEEAELEPILKSAKIPETVKLHK